MHSINDLGRDVWRSWLDLWDLRVFADSAFWLSTWHSVCVDGAKKSQGADGE